MSRISPGRLKVLDDGISMNLIQLSAYCWSSHQRRPRRTDRIACKSNRRPQKDPGQTICETEVSKIQCDGKSRSAGEWPTIKRRPQRSQDADTFEISVVVRS